MQSLFFKEIISRKIKRFFSVAGKSSSVIIYLKRSENVVWCGAAFLQISVDVMFVHVCAMIAYTYVYYNPQEWSVSRLSSDLFIVALSLNILPQEGTTTKYNILFLMKWYFCVYTGQFVRQIGGEGISNYPIGVGINSVGEVLIADNHNNFNLTVFTQVRALVLTVRHPPSVV